MIYLYFLLFFTLHSHDNKLTKKSALEKFTKLHKDSTKSLYDKNTNKISDNLKKKISININIEDDISKVIENLCQMYDINIIVEENIEKKKIVYSATKKELYIIIKEICDILGVKCKIKNNTVIILKNELYIKHYSLSFLSSKYQNKVESSTENTTDNNNNTFNKSNFTSKNISSTESDFWSEIKNSISFIISKTEGGSVSVHPQSGMISVIGKYKDHKEVKKYIKKTQKLIASQIYIDIKIIEVCLHKQYERGIEWNVFKSLLSDLLSKITTGNALQFFQIDQDKASSFLSIIKSLREFGSVKVSSGLIFRLINNHVSRFESSDQEVYIPLKLHQSTNKKKDLSVINSEAKNIPIGLVIQLKACTDIKTNKINLHITTKITKNKGGYIEDPATAIIAAQQGKNITSKVPKTSIISMDAHIIFNSGQTVLLGGLKESFILKKQEKNFVVFKKNKNERKDKEVLIIITGYIVKPHKIKNINTFNNKTHNKIKKPKPE